MGKKLLKVTVSSLGVGFKIDVFSREGGKRIKFCIIIERHDILLKVDEIFWWTKAL